ncbi:YbhN family protein [Candidatus Altiarchaeota archaeon]
MNVSTKHLSVLGLLLFILVLSRIDIDATIQSILDIPPTYIFACLLTVAAEVILRSARWKLLVDQYARDYTVGQSIHTLLMGVAFGAVTPARIGDIIKAFDVRDHGVELKRAVSIEVVDRLLDMFYLFLSAFVGYIFLMMVYLGGQVNGILVALIACAFILFSLVLFHSSRISFILTPIHRFLVPDRFKGQSTQLFTVFQDTLGRVRQPGLFIRLILLTGAWWTVLFIRPFILVKGMGLDISPLVFILVMPVVAVIEVLPISLLGIGTRDVGLIAVFSLLSVPAELMIALSLMMLFLSILPQVFLGYFIAYMKGVSLNVFTKDE